MSAKRFYKKKHATTNYSSRLVLRAARGYITQRAYLIVKVGGTRSFPLRSNIKVSLRHIHPPIVRTF